MLVVLLAMLSLSGCLQARSSFQVHPDDTVSGQLTVYVSKEILTSGGETQESGFAKYRAIIPPLPAGKEQIFDDGTNYGTLISYDRVPLSTFVGSFSITHATNRYTFAVDLDPVALAPMVASGDVEQTTALLRLCALQFSVTLPGTIDTAVTNGTVIGSDTVTWNLPADQNVDKPAMLTAGSIVTAPSSTASSSSAPVTTTTSSTEPPTDGGGSSLLLWLLIIAGLIIVGLVVFVVLLLRRRSAPPAARQESGPVKNPPAPPSS